MSERQRSIEKAMAGFEKKMGPWPAFQKAIKSKAAVANNSLDLGVAMVMADAHEKNVPVKVQLKFKGLDDNKQYGYAETEAYVSKMDSNEMRIGISMNQPIQVPQDTLVTLKMQSPNFETTQRPTLLMETAAGAEPSSTGVVSELPAAFIGCKAQPGVPRVERHCHLPFLFRLEDYREHRHRPGKKRTADGVYRIPGTQRGEYL